MDTRFQLSMLLWISICISLNFCGYPCFDLLWILDPGIMMAMHLHTHMFIKGRLERTETNLVKWEVT